MKSLIIFFILLFLSLNQASMASTAEKTLRWIDIEWDEVPGARGYDIELFEVIDQKDYTRGLFHTDKPHWAKEAPAGKYTVKIRALDNRRVPGPWGESLPIMVKLSPPQLLKPLNNEVITNSDTEDLYVHFQWNEATGAALYQFILFNSKNQVIANLVSKEQEVKLNVSRIDTYKWFVLPLLSADEKKEPAEFLTNTNELATQKAFQIKGTPLISPVISIEVIQKKGMILKWEEIYRAENYNYEVFRDENNELKKVFSGNSKKTIIAIPKDRITKGKYLIAIKAQALKYRDSEPARILIQSENDSIDILKNESQVRNNSSRSSEPSVLEAQFGYPNFKYNSKNYDLDTVNTESLRGVEVQGKWQKSFLNSRFFNAINFDLSQSADSNVSALSYGFSETIGLKFHFGKSTLELGTGPRIDSTPLLYADRFENKITKQYFLTLGPDFSFIYHYQFNDLWKILFKTHLSPMGLKLSSPDGSKLQSAINSATELRLNYTLNGFFDLYTGLKLVSHTLKTKALLNVGSFAQSSDINEVSFSSTHFIFGTQFFY